MPLAPKMFRCPKCRHSYLGHDPLPDCPRCGYDYRESESFRWDLVVYLLSIIGFVSFILVASYYRGNMGTYSVAPRSTTRGSDTGDEKLPGAGSGNFKTPYHDSSR